LKELVPQTLFSRGPLLGVELEHELKKGLEGLVVRQVVLTFEDVLGLFERFWRPTLRLSISSTFLIDSRRLATFGQSSLWPVFCACSSLEWKRLLKLEELRSAMC
jgi:hypothetical protein